ncbi:MAG: UbiX family flavin prenyltransferase [Actinobacteria bacterium]|nr:UbiX family flavin prenyltransferase [Actinomycetota bacterium]
MSVLTIGITGASGSIYGERLIRTLILKGFKINLIISDKGKIVFETERGFSLDGEKETVQRSIRDYFNDSENKINYFDNNDFKAPIASGSSSNNLMIVIPCSMGALSRIANGNSENLIERTADVILKENKKLILVPREAPLNQIHLSNMLKLSKMGVLIVPASPAFYHQPETIDDLVDFIIGKVLDLVGIEHDLYKRWGV